MPITQSAFDELVQEAWEQGMQGWDWSYLKGRLIEESTPWDYLTQAKALIGQAQGVLEIGTGGGELFATLGPFPPQTVATEAYPPSVNLAGRSLRRVGVSVVQTEDVVAIPLPFADDSFDLVLNRHADYNPQELFRVLRPDGRVYTQQVGGQNQFRLNEIFQDNPEFIYGYWTLEYARRELTAAGFEIVEQREAFPETRFLDIGALVYFLKVIDWQVPGFDPHLEREKLLWVYEQIQRAGALVTYSHRWVIEAVKRA